jgi:hypothetical protein
MIFVGHPVNGHNRRLIDHNFVVLYDDGIRSAQVYGNLLGKE